jgi:hypothetical protein
VSVPENLGRLRRVGAASWVVALVVMVAAFVIGYLLFR